MSLETKLYIYSATYATSGVIDLYQDIPISLQYSITDIKEPQKKKSFWSKTITVPGTANNNKLLAAIYDIQIDRTFNPNHKTNAIIQCNGVDVINGNMQLLKIRLLDGKIEYELVITGKIANIYTEMGNRKLSDINLATYNHTLNSTNIVNSWSATPGSGYVYPFIDYGLSINQLDYKLTDFFPAIYVKEYIDQIFNICGFQYSSTFFSSAFFKRLIIPFNNAVMKLSNATVALRQIRASLSANQLNANLNTTTIAFDDETTTPNTDPSGQYDNATTHKVTIANAGRYDISAVIYPRLRVLSAGTWAGKLNVTMVIKDASGNTLLTSSYPVNYGAATYTTGLKIGSPSQTTNSVINYFLGVNYTITWSISGVQNNASPPYTAPVGTAVLSTSYFNIIVNNSQGLQEGDTIPINDCLPQNITMRDFFTSIVRMFNLYIEIDKDTANKLLIEPRDDYYSLSYVNDWTNKIDRSEPIEITPMAELNAKQYLLKYSDDDDYFNKMYQDREGFTYGYKLIDVDNDFLTNREEIAPIFAATPLTGTQKSNRIYPEILPSSSTGTNSPKTNKLRILYYGGLLTSTPAWNLKSSTATTSQSTYPYAGHLDNPYNPTVDLSFGLPTEIYYPIYNPNYSSTLTYTDNNIYHKYWAKTITEITDKNSSIVGMTAKLTPTDIETLDFRAKVFVDGVLYHLNQIENYNPTELGTCKIELIKMKEGTSFTPYHAWPLSGAVSYTSGIYSARIPTTGAAPGIGGGINTTQGITSPRTGNTIIGEGNVVSPTANRVFINGSYNSVGDDAQNITIINSSGVIVGGGLTNVQVMNSSGVTISESNVIYDYSLPTTSRKRSIMVVSSGTTQLLITDPTVILVDPMGGTSTIIPPEISSVYQGYELTVKKITSGTVTIDPLSTITIDGATTYTLSAVYDVITISFDGTNYNIVNKALAAGGGGGEDLSATLAIGNTTGANDIVITNGRQIKSSSGTYSIQQTFSSSDWTHTSYDSSSSKQSIITASSFDGSGSFYSSDGVNASSIANYVDYGLINSDKATYQGYKYNADYSANYTDRSLIDKGYITTRVSSGVVSGEYTPTLTGVANITSSTAYQCQWLRTDYTITVSGKVDLTPTATATSTKLGITIPISSNFGAEEDCTGVAFAKAIASVGAAILADSANDRAQLEFISSGTSSISLYFTFTYRVI